MTSRRPLAEVPQYQVEAEEREDGSGQKDVHILRAVSAKYQYRISTKF
jgi:hypothetical protein